MPTYGLIEYADASPEVRAVYDDIMATRKVDSINNFWKAIANDPVLLKRTWESIKQIMAPGALDPLMKEMIYVAVSVTNGSSAPGAMICLMLSQVRFSRAGSWAIAFQKLLIQSTWRVAMMSS